MSDRAEIRSWKYSRIAALLGFESNSAAIPAEAAARASRIFSFLEGRPFFFPGGSSETSSIRSGVAGGIPTGRAERIAGGRISNFADGGGIEGARLRIGVGRVDGNRGVVRAARIAGGKIAGAPRQPSGCLDCKTFILIKRCHFRRASLI